MAKTKEFIGFGFDPAEAKHHFLVIIPKLQDEKVMIYERFEWGTKDDDMAVNNGRYAITEETEQKIDPRFDRLKCEISRIKWKEIEVALKAEFNQRLKSYGQKNGNWKQGQNILQRLFGKELTLLCWAIEDADLRVIPVAIKNWLGLKPEERWWLYTMTNASTGDASAKYGWRTAIRYALTENPVTGTNPQHGVFDQYINDAIENYQKKK